MSLLTGVFADILAEQRQQQIVDVEVARAIERRSSLENPQSPLSFPAEWLLDIFNGGRTDSGVRVSQMTAFQVTTFFSCVDLISGAIAALPRHVYERTFLQNGRAAHGIAYDHNYEDLIHLEPNDEMSSFGFIKALMCHVLAWGNGYAEIQRDGGNRALALWPRNPDKTKPVRLSQAVRLDPTPWRPFPVNLPAGTLAFSTTDSELNQNENGSDRSGQGRIIAAADMIHVPGLSLDGRIGQDVVWMARQLIGLALVTEKFGAKYFSNYAKPGGLLELPAGMKKEDREQAKNTWQEAQGGENAHRVAAMPAGTKFTPITNTPEDAQATLTREFLRVEIATGLFHVPAHMVGSLDRSRANTEQMAQEFLSYCLQPHLVAIKQEFKRKLFPHPGIGRAAKNRFYFDFDTWSLLRPDADSREKFYSTMKQWGVYSTNDILEREGQNPLDDPSAEDRWMPINMTLVETPVDPTHQDGAGNGDVPAPANDPQAKADQRYAQPFQRLFRDAFGRICSRSGADVKAFQGCFGPVLYSLRDCFSAEAEATPGAETDRFIADYIGSMHKRSAEWQNTDEASRAELMRAVRAVRIAVAREAAAEKAKEN